MDTYLCKPASECHCKGLNANCPDCEYSDMWQKAKKLQIGKRYKMSESNNNAIKRMYELFSEPCHVHPRNWIIDIENNRVIRKEIEI